MNDNSDPKKIVRDSYDRLDRRYADWARTVDDTGRRRWTDYLLGSLPDDSRVLDLGCGDGSLLTANLSSRFDVTGVDLSSVQLARARSIAPNAHFICADMSSLSLPDESFDAVCAFYSLTHLPQEDVPVVVQSIARWLRPSGVFVGSFGSNDEPGSVDADWLGVPMYFSGHSPDMNRRIVEEAGLSIEHDTFETSTEFEQKVIFHWIAARK